MDLQFLIQGVIIGFSIAAPVGPIGVLCIRRTLASGRLSGLVSGLGAASADAIYGCIAGFGLTFISSFLVAQGTLLRWVGGLFLIYLGITTFLSRPANQKQPDQRTSLLQAYFSTLLLTLTNPMTILSFVAIFASLGLAERGNDQFISVIIFVLGVFTGSALWWLFLSEAVNAFRKKFNLEALKWVNRISGAIIVIFGLLALFNLL
ncbi:MAG TPA: LysE family transporter [Anaerolineaceae bacterium]|nr:LysE family transporter [Anaerolineaceae bacterium]HPN52355.1 LysE family transporter [Anaerolineaceae bacterium]